MNLWRPRAKDVVVTPENLHYQQRELWSRLREGRMPSLKELDQGPK